MTSLILGVGIIIVSMILLYKNLEKDDSKFSYDIINMFTLGLCVVGMVFFIARILGLP